MEQARALFFGGAQPRGLWLCVNDDSYGASSLRTYFPCLSADAFLEEFAKMGGKTVMKQDDEVMFRAGRSEAYGSNHRWVAFGKIRPAHGAGEQLGNCAKKPAVTASAPDLSGGRRHSSAPTTTSEQAAAASGVDLDDDDSAEEDEDDDDSGSSDDQSADVNDDDDDDSVATADLNSDLDDDTGASSSKLGEEEEEEQEEDQQHEDLSEETQTPCAFFSIGKMHQLINFINELPKGAVCDVDITRVGLCVRLTLKLSGGGTFVMPSAERVGKSKQLHPNLRYVRATCRPTLAFDNKYKKPY